MLWKQRPLIWSMRLPCLRLNQVRHTSEGTQVLLTFSVTLPGAPPRTCLCYYTREPKSFSTAVVSSTPPSSKPMPGRHGLRWPMAAVGAPTGTKIEQSPWVPASPGRHPAVGALAGTKKERSPWASALPQLGVHRCNAHPTWRLLFTQPLMLFLRRHSPHHVPWMWSFAVCRVCFRFVSLGDMCGIAQLESAIYCHTGNNESHTTHATPITFQSALKAVRVSHHSYPTISALPVT